MPPAPTATSTTGTRRSPSPMRQSSWPNAPTSRICWHSPCCRRARPLGALGRLHEGIALITAGLQVAREHDLTEPLLAGLTLRGFHLGEINNEEAMASYREGLELARRAGHRGMVLQFINNMGYSGFVVGEWDEALAAMDEVLAGDVGAVQPYLGGEQRAHHSRGARGGDRREASGAGRGSKSTVIPGCAYLSWIPRPLLPRHAAKTKPRRR